MTFELSSALSDQLLFSMEDQTCGHCLDAEKGVIVEILNGEGKAPVNVDEENFYSLPEWNSSDGYSLLENFTNNLHSPLARQELRMVLEGGRGVFRNFKNVLKAYPDVEKRFHRYKNAVMKERIMDWYNGLRESWGLEKLALSESDYEEDMDELVNDDFTFTEYDSARDWNNIQKEASFLLDEHEAMFGEEVGSAIFEMENYFSSFSAPGEKIGFVCRNHSEEFTGCALFSRLSHSGKSGFVKSLALTDFFVLKEYRGLGIGGQLISESLSFFKKKGFHWVLISNIYIPEEMESLLVHYGFERRGQIFLANLFNDVR